MTRKEQKTYDNEYSAASFVIDTTLEIWGTNSTLEDKKVVLRVDAFDLYDPEWTESWNKEVILSGNSSTELFKGPVPGQPRRTKDSQVPRPIIVSARLLDDEGNVLGRYSNW
jgi:beta-mannosidase